MEFSTGVNCHNMFWSIPLDSNFGVYEKVYSSSYPILFDDMVYFGLKFNLKHVGFFIRRQNEMPASV